MIEEEEEEEEEEEGFGSPLSLVKFDYSLHALAILFLKREIRINARDNHFVSIGSCICVPFIIIIIIHFFTFFLLLAVVG